MSQNINDLRSAMFDALKLLNKGEITVEQARAASEIGKVLIDSAKVENEYLKITGNSKSEFIEPQPDLPNGVTGITRHRLAG